MGENSQMRAMRCAGELQPGEHALLHMWLVANEHNGSVTLQGFGHLQPLDVLRADASIGHVRALPPRSQSCSWVTSHPLCCAAARFNSARHALRATTYSQVAYRARVMGTQVTMQLHCLHTCIGAASANAECFYLVSASSNAVFASHG